MGLLDETLAFLVSAACTIDEATGIDRCATLAQPSDARAAHLGLEANVLVAAGRWRRLCFAWANHLSDLVGCVPDAVDRHPEDSMTAATTTWIAIVGAGQMERQYRATIDRIPDAEIRFFAEQIGEWCDSAADRFDAVLVADPFLDPAQLADLAKPIFLPHTSSASIAHLAEAFRQAPTNLSVGMPLRFRADIAAVKESFDSGQLGVPGLLRIHCWRQSDGARDRWLLDEIDLTRWFFGNSPRSIYAVGRSINATDDYIQVHLGFHSGGMAMIDVNSALPPGDSYRALSLIGSAGAAYADDHHNMQLVYQGDHPVAVRTEANGDVLLAELTAFVDSVRTTQKLHFDADAWQATMAVAKAVDASKQAGRAVHLVEQAYELI